VRKGSTADPTRKASNFASTVEDPFANGSDPREVYDVRHDETGNPDGNSGPPRPVRAFDYATIIEHLRGEQAFEDHGRGVLILAHEPSPRLVLTAIAAARRTGERRVADSSTVQVLEGEVRFTAGEERHVLSAGGTLVLQGNVFYDAEAMSDAAFLHTLVHPVEQDRGSRSRRILWSPRRDARTWTYRGQIGPRSGDPRVVWPGIQRSAVRRRLLGARLGASDSTIRGGEVVRLGVASIARLRSRETIPGGKAGRPSRLPDAPSGDLPPCGRRG
jgi:quercetin dioxygenase-like cupin family protein